MNLATALVKHRVAIARLQGRDESVISILGEHQDPQAAYRLAAEQERELRGLVNAPAEVSVPDTPPDVEIPALPDYEIEINVFEGLDELQDEGLIIATLTVGFVVFGAWIGAMLVLLIR